MFGEEFGYRTIIRIPPQGQHKRGKSLDQILSDAQDRLAAIKARIKKGQARFGPPANIVELVAVSKTFSAPEIAPFIAAGQRVFGENRVQEASAKWPSLRQHGVDIQLHLIGPLQTNKAREAVALFDCIQTLDRDKLAGVLKSEMMRAKRQLPCFVQVNIGGEAQKSGIAPSETVDFVARCRAEHGLDIIGLMCIPPDGQAPGPYFAYLATLAAAAQVHNLSMGMSADFETAIAMGATHVRVGSALFGHRAKI